MDQYDFEPVRIRQPAERRRVVFVGAVVALLLAILVVKPWEGVGTPAGPTGVTVSLASIAPSSSPTPVATPTDPSIRDWPVRTIPPSPVTTLADREAMVAGLAPYAGKWGVGSAGVGPRILREEPWSDWVAVAPATVRVSLGRMTPWAYGESCGDAPTIFDRPSLIGITFPASERPTWRLGGWWTDGTYVVELAGSIRAVSPPDSRGIGYFERTDGGPWPVGRYEFRLIDGESAVALTVCLTRRG